MPELILKLGERIIQSYPLDKDELRIGRARDNDIVIDNISVSRNHARINREEGEKYFLTDLNSSNGTLVNGVRVATSELLHEDQLTVGKHVIQFLNPQQEQPSSASQEEMLRTKAPVLEVVKGKQQGASFRLQGDEVFMGRSSENRIRIHDWFVSKRHALLLQSRGGYVIRDLDSWRGTAVNGASTREAKLNDGDEIVVGTTTLRFRMVPVEDLPPESDASVPAAAGGGDARQPSEASDISQHDDEFAPLTDEEMRALEEEADMHEGTPEEEAQARRAHWEFQEAEEEFLHEQQDPKAAARRDSEEMISLDGIMTGDIEQRAEGKLEQQAVEEIDKEEEQALFDGEMPEEDPGTAELEEAATGTPAEKKDTEEGKDGTEVALWTRALSNRSPVIRKYAATRLKVLTGQDYDWESQPEGQ